MKTRNKTLEATVAEWHQDAEPPTALRNRVLNAAPFVPSPEPSLTPGLHHHRVWWATVGALALSGAAATALFTVSTPARPAYADVERATRQVTTVQYRETHTIYATKTGKVRRQITCAKIRLDIPAVRRDSHDWLGIDTPQWHLFRIRNHHGGWRSMVTPEPRRINSGDLFRDDPAARLRWRIEHDLVPPKPDGLNKVLTSEIIEGGRQLTRFDFQKRGKNFGPGRLTRTGWRETVWADTRTRRVVRTQHEYYNGAIHSLDVNDQFRYDEPLPDGLFDTSRPQKSLSE